MGQKNSYSQMNVLCVDDSDEDLDVISSLVRDNFGAKVSVARSGHECLDLASKAKFDLILLDNRMPDVDGIDLIYQGTLKAPIILLTGQGSEILARNAFKSGAVDYLSKDLIMTPLFINCLDLFFKSAAKQRATENDFEEKDHLKARPVMTEEVRLSKFFKLAPWPMAYLKGPDFIIEEANPPMFDLLARIERLKFGSMKLDHFFDDTIVELATSVYESGHRLRCRELPIRLKKSECKSSGSAEFTFDVHLNDESAIDGLVLMLNEQSLH